MDTSLPTVEAFVDELIRQKFARTPLDESVMADIRRELTERLNQYLTLRTIESVSATNPEAIGELSNLIKTNPPAEKVQQYIRNLIKDPDVLVAQFFADFRTLYLGSAEDKHN